MELPPFVHGSYLAPRYQPPAWWNFSPSYFFPPPHHSSSLPLQPQPHPSSASTFASGNIFPYQHSYASSSASSFVSSTSGFGYSDTPNIKVEPGSSPRPSFDMNDYPSPSTGGGMPFGQSQMNGFYNNVGPFTSQETDQYDTGHMNGYMGTQPYSKEWMLDGNVNFTHSSMLPQQPVGDGHQPFARAEPVYNYSRIHEILTAYAGMGFSEKLMVEFAAQLAQLSDEEYATMMLHDPVVNKGLVEQHTSRRDDQKSFSDEPQTTSSVTLPSGDEEGTDLGEFESAADLKRAIDDFKARPKPDLNDREARNQYLIRGRELNISYGEIKKLGGFPQTDSTLRGRHRVLTKPAGMRVRSPKWRRSDFIIMQKLVNAYTRYDKEGRPIVPWRRIAEEMWEIHGSSYKFCTATVARAGRMLADEKHKGRIPAGVPA